MKINENHFSLIAFTGFFVFLFIGVQNTSKQEQVINEDIDNNLFVTIAKLKDCGRYYSSYIYYFDKKSMMDCMRVMETPIQKLVNTSL